MARVRRQTTVNQAEKPGAAAPAQTAPRANGNLYERDYYSWAIGQARALRDRKDSKLDWENLADEVEDLANRNRIDAWLGGRDHALGALAMPDAAIPEACQWTFEQAMPTPFKQL